MATEPVPVDTESDADELERLEIELLLEAVYRRYGFDFRDYAPASLKRRLWRRIRAEGLESVSGLQERLLHDPAVMERLLLDLSINVTAMFRDPTFYVAFREKVVPLLRTYPFVRIWNAGCSTGEEIVLAGHPARGGGPARPLPHLRHRHQRGGARAAPAPASSRSTRCRSTRATTSGPAARARSPSTTSRPTTAPSSPARSSTTSSSPSTTSSRTARSTSST